VHKGYEFNYPKIPVPALEEALAEKLAAWRRRKKIRDLYDLSWFGRGTLDERLVRKVLVLKVWHDVVDDGLGSAPFEPGEVVADIDVTRLPPEDIGLLTQPVEPKAWLASVRSRYQFVTALDDLEQKLAGCNPGDRWQVDKLVAALAQ
jgi:predicted nucleotidyltransferase component of viral defense system